MKGPHEFGKAPLEPGAGDDLVHLRPDALHLGEADLVDLPRRQVRGGRLAHFVGVPRGATGQVPEPDALPGVGDVNFGEKAQELAEGRGGLLVGVQGRLAEPRLILRRHVGRDLPEPREQGALPGIVGQQSANLVGRAQHHALRRRDAGREPLLHQGDLLIDQGRQRAQPGQTVLVIARGRGGRDAQEHGDARLDTIVLGKHHLIAGKAEAFDLTLQPPAEEVEVDLLRRRQPAAVDGQQGLQLFAPGGVTALDAGRREVRPPVVVAGKSRVGGKLGSREQLFLPGEIEQTAKPLALADRRGGPDRGQDDEEVPRD